MVCTCLLILCRVSPPAEFDNHDIIMGDVCLLSLFAVCMAICLCVCSFWEATVRIVTDATLW